jgi:hypothetical protein
MLGDWGIGDEEGLIRAKEGEGDFHVDKNWYSGVDDECKILKVQKQAENLYTVQASCNWVDSNLPPKIFINEFELKGDKLLITPVSS